MARSKKAEQPTGEDSHIHAAESGHIEESQDSAVNGGDGDLEAEQEASEATLEEQLATAAQEAETYKDRFLRARADLENYRKRSVQFITEGVRDGQRQTFEAILPVIDNLERAVDYQEQHKADSVEDLLTGVRMTLWQLREVLERQEVKRIEALGEPFDPRYHEAVEVQPAEGDVEADTVVGEIQTGYLFGDAVLRPAKVRVAQPRQTAATDEEPTEAT